MARKARPPALSVVVLAWAAALAWGTCEVVLIRSSQANNTWGLPAALAMGLASVVLFVCIVPKGGGQITARRRVPVVVLGVGALAVSAAVWAVEAPLPELRAVPLPPAGAGPTVVVRTFVAALDQHDRATARALCEADDPPCQFLDYYVRVRVTHLGQPMVVNNDGFLPRGVTGVDVGVFLAGETRAGGPVGEDGYWGYVVAPMGPRGVWRIVDDGTG